MEAKRSLTKLVGDFHALEQLLIESEGEMCETMNEWMDLNKGDIAQKVDGYKLFMDHCNAKAEYFEERSKEFGKAANALWNHAERMKQAVKNAMLEMNVTDLNGVDFRFKLSPSKPKVEIISEDEIPAQYFVEKVSLQPDKVAIGEALAAGTAIAGVKWVEGKTIRSYVNSTTKKAVKSE